MHEALTRFGLLLAASLPIAAFAADTLLHITAPYVRLAAPALVTTGAFMRIVNDSDQDRQLLRAESPVARRVELHSHVNDSGVMKMREVAAIEIKAKGETELKPGSYHIMLIDMKQSLSEGELVPLTLRFDDGSSQRIEAPVRKSQSAPPAGRIKDQEGISH